MFDRQRSKFDDIAIAAPCPISWEEMEGDERIKYCSLCHLNVYNLSEMTRKEGEALFDKAGEQVCIRLYRRADGTIITKDCPVRRRLADACARRVRTVVLALLAFFFAGSGKASAADCETSDGNGSQSTSKTSSVSETPKSGARWGICVNGFRGEKSALPRGSFVQNSGPRTGIGFAPNRWLVPKLPELSKPIGLPKPSGLPTIENLIVPALLNRPATFDHTPQNGAGAAGQKADYAKFLRKQGRSDLANAVLAEFAAPPPKPKSGIKFSSNKKQEPK